MTIFFSSSSFFEESGNAAAKFSEQLRDSIAGHACTIWKGYPDFFTQNKNPVSSYVRGYMNGVCEAQGREPAPINRPVTGGQCPNVEYDVEIEYTLGATGATRTRTPRVFGKVVEATSRSAQGGGAIEIGVIAGTAEDPDASFFYAVDIYAATAGQPAFVNILSNTRVDGLPDDCGDRPPSYPPSPPPNQNDLSATINIINVDGINNTFELTWNQVDENYNFPMHFKLDGSNVSIDVGGIHIYGNPEVTSSNDNNGTNAPGSDGGKDVDGNPYEEPFEDSTFLSVPELVQPELKPVDLEYFLCETGIISGIIKTIELPNGLNPLYSVLLEIFKNLIEEICEVDNGDVGIPEIYPVLPGADRPVIMYYFKQVIDGFKQASTYVATLPNPGSDAIGEINNVSVPNRKLGKFVASIKLLDGSRIVSRGDTEGSALSFFNFLLSRVSPTLIPSDINNATVITEQPRLQVIEVVCTQIEYYPEGKSFGRNPTIKRVIRLD